MPSPCCAQFALSLLSVLAPSPRVRVPAPSLSMVALLGRAAASSRLDVTAAKDDSSLSKLARMVPRPLHTRDSVMDAKRLIEFNYQVQIIDAMQKHPDIIVPLHGLFMSHDLSAMSTSTSCSSSTWTGKYKQVDRLPKPWVAEFVLSRARANGLAKFVTADTLSELELHMPDAIPMLFSFVTQTIGSSTLPAECADQRVCSQVFVKRAEECGARLQHLFQNGGFTKKNIVQYSRGGCYALQFDDDGLLSELKHCSGAVAKLPTHISIDRTFVLNDNHLDHLATISKSPLRFRLHELFADTETFKVGMIVPGKTYKRLQQLAEVVVSTLKKEESDRQESVVTEAPEVFEAAKKRRCTENMAKAREGLKNREKLRAAACTVTLQEDTEDEDEAAG